MLSCRQLIALGRPPDAQRPRFYAQPLQPELCRTSRWALDIYAGATVARAFSSSSTEFCLQPRASSRADVHKVRHRSPSSMSFATRAALIGPAASNEPPPQDGLEFSRALAQCFPAALLRLAEHRGKSS